ncbi:helix-turn-helix domain-containing protein, partial [Streptomyces sp. NPDC001774]
MLAVRAELGGDPRDAVGAVRLAVHGPYPGREPGVGRLAGGPARGRWTLARVQTVIRRRLRLTLSVATVWRLLKRHGWS